jgi:hypothetical protein
MSQQTDGFKVRATEDSMETPLISLECYTFKPLNSHVLYLSLYCYLIFLVCFSVFLIFRS